jgi:hypothetical protein
LAQDGLPDPIRAKLFEHSMDKLCEIRLIHGLSARGRFRRQGRLSGLRRIQSSADVPREENERLKERRTATNGTRRTLRTAVSWFFFTARVRKSSREMALSASPGGDAGAGMVLVGCRDAL